MNSRILRLGGAWVLLVALAAVAAGGPASASNKARATGAAKATGDLLRRPGDRVVVAGHFSDFMAGT